MHIQLTPLEARVLGALIEKEITTPDQYPLSVNALTNACNQKTNRDPVLSLDDRTVQEVLDGLSKRHLVMERSGFGSRVVKYRHRLCNGDHNPLKLSPQEVAVMCELMLRGPQTPGELRGRAQRLATFTDLGDIETTLELLAARADGPYVAKLPRQPGARDSRYCQLFTGEPDLEAMALAVGHAEPASAHEPGLAARVQALEEAVADLRAELAALREAPAP
ncbi:MAG: DUF480 domain-containing protein [Proteobacteria bacterium]|nr:DUF480 domain-containing protein [Pseudomonadota bacterium]